MKLREHRCGAFASDFRGLCRHSHYVFRAHSVRAGYFRFWEVTAVQTPIFGQVAIALDAMHLYLFLIFHLCIFHVQRGDNPFVLHNPEVTALELGHAPVQRAWALVVYQYWFCVKWTLHALLPSFRAGAWMGLYLGMRVFWLASVHCLSRLLPSIIPR